MSQHVVDASAVVEYLLKTPLGVTAADIILTAPELMDAQVGSVLWRAALNGNLEKALPRMAADDLAYWPVDRISQQFLAALTRPTGMSAPTMRSTSPRPAPMAARC